MANDNGITEAISDRPSTGALTALQQGRYLADHGITERGQYDTLVNLW
jgi:hypothetical protein